jgi:hypothetical protein
MTVILDRGSRALALPLIRGVIRDLGPTPDECVRLLNEL